MKNFFFFSCLIFSQLTFASDPRSLQMVELLLRSGVDSYGKKEYLRAEIGCKKTEKKGFFCFVSSLNDFDFMNYVEYTGEEAQEVSSLLKDFEIIPFGKKLFQAASFECRIPKNSPDGKRVCSVLQTDIFTDWI